MPKTLPLGRPVRVGVLGVGQVFELTSRAYDDCPDAELVALCDTDPERLAERGRRWPDAALYTDLDAFLAHDLDLVEVLLPTPMHADIAEKVLRAGHHLALQKPITHTLEEADRIIALAEQTGAVVRVMEDQIFFPPLVALKEVVDSGQLGKPVGLHLKMVVTGLGGWDVKTDGWKWLLQQAQGGKGIAVFDDGWHKFAIAMWLLGPVKRVMAWIGATDVGGGYTFDAPTHVMWEHENGVRGILDITFAPGTFLRSDYYTGDERVEVTCELGFARVNHISARGLALPALEVYRDGELRGDHKLPDGLHDGFIAAGHAFAHHLRTGEGAPSLTLRQARDVLAFMLAIYESSERDAPVNVADIG
ncbi:MAG TPA: Gfo/Idh/MocA family oxidoreductase [Mycobacteriales bacterium]|nr:Gfo/Idh/MocA family oxidoreductase [Mycobacteriales bacterium]